jgi:hypothetical protein
MSKRMSHPATPAITIVTALSSGIWLRGQRRKDESVSSHPLGDFEDEPAQTGEAQAPKNHHHDHRLDLSFYRMITSLPRESKSQIVKGQPAL